MHMTDLPSLLVTLISLTTSLALGVYTWSRRQYDGARPIAVLLFCESAAVSGFLLEMLSASLAAHIFWDLLQWMVLPVLALAIFDLSVGFKNPLRYQAEIRRGLVGISVLFGLLILTNSLHQLIIHNPRLIVTNTGRQILFYNYTPLAYTIIAYIYGIVIFSFARLLSLPGLLQPIYRLQIKAILGWLGILLIGSFPSLFDMPLFWGQRDVSPVIFGLSNLVLAWGLFRYHLFDIGSAARALVTDTIHDPMIVVDTYHQVMDLNQAARQCFGFAESGAIPLALHEAPAAWQHLFERFANSQFFQGEVTLTIDGQTKFVDLTISSIHDSRRLLQGRLFFMRDITAQKLAQDTLRASEESYNGLFNTVKEAIYILSSDGIFLDVNKGAENMYGYTRAEFIGQTPAFVSAPGRNDLQAIGEMHQRVFATGRPEEFEFWGIRKNGEEFPKECIANKGTYFGQAVIITTARDVTVRKQIEAALIQSEQRFRSYIHNVPDTITVIDQTGRIKFINRTEAAHSSSMPSEKNIFDFIAPEERATSRAAIAAAVVTGQPEQYITSSQAHGATTWYDNRVMATDPGNFSSDLVILSSNITERRHAEQALNESEALYRLLAERVSDVIWILDVNEMRFRYVSPSVERLRGYTVEEVMAQGMAEVLSPESLQLLEEELPQRLQEFMTGASGYFVRDVQQPCKDGTTVWTEATTSFQINETNGHLEVYGVSRDISERKRVEAALRESEARWQFALEGSGDGVWDMDVVGQKAFYSRQWKTMLGYEENEIGDSPEAWQSLIHPEDRDMAWEKIQEHVLLQTPFFIIEHRMRAKDGTYHWILDRGKVIERTEAGFPTRIIGTHTDITDRKQAEAALAESEAKFHGFFTNSMDAMFLFNEHAEVTEVNQAAEKLLEMKQAELAGRSVWDIQQSRMPKVWQRPEVLEAIRATVEEVARTGTSKWANTTVEGVMEMPNQQIRHIQTTIFTIPYHGRHRFGSIVRDVTADKNIQMERERFVSELQAKNGELERYTYTVSHDLKTPLITIRGFLDYLEKDLAANRSERVKQDVDYILNAADKMQHLLDNLLELSRIGRILNPVQVVAAEAVVQDAANLTAGRLENRHVTLEVEPGLPMISCDRTRLTQVYQNLIDNAVKFMGDQPEPHIWVGQTQRDGEPLLFVRDNGMGIAPEHLTRVFGLFDKLNRNTEGTGIGLALVKRIIETHGGRIWVESEGPGKGSTFYFTLPAAYQNQ